MNHCCATVPFKKTGFSLKHLVYSSSLSTSPLSDIPNHHNCYLMILLSVFLCGSVVRALRQQRKRLWVRFPGNTHTD